MGDPGCGLGIPGHCPADSVVVAVGRTVSPEFYRQGCEVEASEVIAHRAVEGTVYWESRSDIVVVE